MLALTRLLTAGKAHVGLIGTLLAVVVAVNANSTLGHWCAALLALPVFAGVYKAPRRYGHRDR